MKLALPLLLLVPLSVPLAAQTHVRTTSHPLRSVHVDLATGTVTRGAAVHPRTAATVSDFPNMDLSGFVATDTGGGRIEWFGDGVKGVSGNASDMMDSIVFAYCSAMRDTSLGGPGGTVKLGFYEGYTRNGGPSGAPNGTAVAVFTLTGLPANSASSSFWGGFGCYFATVEFAALVPFADGPIGYSWKFLDLGSDGTLAGTFPYLSNAGTCVGTTPYPDALGQWPYTCCSLQPADVYLDGILRVVFTFAPYCIAYAVGIDIREAADVSATAAPYTGDGINADVLSASSAVVGQSWSAQVTLGHPHGTGGPVNLRVRTGALNGPNLPSPIGGRLTELLVGGPLLASFLTTHDGVRTPLVTAAVPLQLALVCQPWAVQATLAGGGFADLSTAAVGVTGTQ